MLELYAQCPKCGERLVGHDEVCPRCHEAHAEKRHPVRNGVLIAVGIVAFVFFFLSTAAPQMLPRGLRLAKPEEAVAAVAQKPKGPAAWAWDAPEPSTRAWAWPLEKSLETACKQMRTRLGDPKYLSGFLNPRLAKADVTLARAVPASAGSPRTIQSDEMIDAREAMGLIDDKFIRLCMRWTFEVVVNCAQFAQKLETPEAEYCIIPPVQRVLAVQPWKQCADDARLPQVKAACLSTAVDMAKWEDRRNARVQ